MATEQQKKAIPLREGLFHIPTSSQDRGYLIGSKCSNCGYVSFPKRIVCPSCLKDNTMKEVNLSGKARLDRFTVAHQAPVGLKAPYIQAYVQLEEGPMLFTLVDGVEQKADALKPDQKMEVVIGKVKEDEQGNDLIAWKFRPLTPM
ncbi:MAG: Zn-ribbon domain-containing OB-fold protein [Vicinamibacterales bacterium]|nr:Zn-ribbon domain-containing OB-fold protein [Vicinamibacterales bacterium]